jgi:NAD(P)-dependent dehydrogenase (short-subunit alcohol dehydrogenase family)
MAGKLSGRVVLVAGGAGTVGEWVVRVFLREGARVIVPSRSMERLERLREFVAHESPESQARLLTLLGDVGTVPGAEALREEIARRGDAIGPLDAVVASLGGSYDERLPLLQAPPEVWQRFQDNNLNAHYACARTFLPALSERAGASYTLLGGLSAVLPIAKYGPVCVNSAAQLMLARVLFEELKGTRVRINQVMCGMVHTRARAAYARPEWITAEEIGELLTFLLSPEGRMVANSVIQLGDRPS